MSTILYLCRHGNTFESNEVPVQVGAKTDLPLTTFGLQQGQKLGQFFATVGPVSHIFSGPLKRQMQTASEIQNALPDVEMSVATYLSEIDYGPWEGLTSDAIAENWKAAYELWNTKHIWPENLFPEPKSAYIDRLNAFLAEIKTHYPDQTVIAVTSNGLLQLLHHLISNEEKAAKVKTGYWCKIIIDENQISVAAWNESP